MGAGVFSFTWRKTLEPIAVPGFVLGGGNVARRDGPDAREFGGRMLSIHSENCRNSISRREKSHPGPGGNVPGQFRPAVLRQPAFTKRSCG